MGKEEAKLLLFSDNMAIYLENPPPQNVIKCYYIGKDFQ